MATFGALPAAAAWHHQGARAGFEVAFFERLDDVIRVTGETTAVEEGEPWWVGYEIELDEDWTTRHAIVRGRSSSGARETRLESDGAGAWRVDGGPAPQLDGCRDLDLESSSLTNAFPVHRLPLEPGVPTQAPAAYVRALDLRAERLEQTYVDLGDRRFDYTSPQFDFRCELIYDDAGLVLSYPAIATRAF